MKPSLLTRVADHAILPGLIGFTKIGHRLKRRRWSDDSIDVSGRRIVLTGATSGLGLAAARRLAAGGADLVIVGRDEAKLETTRAELAGTGDVAPIRIEVADLSLMREVRALAARLLDDGQPIHVLINNAGALFPTYRRTAEGLEATFALNLLSPFVFTNALFPRLEESAPSRVINVSSGGMYTQGIDPEALQMASDGYDGARAYARAKRGLVILTELWAEMWQDAGVAVNAMHPGWADTPGLESSLAGFHRLVGPLLRTAAEGADTVVWLAGAAEVAEATGGFYLDREPHGTNVFPGTDLDAAGRAALWQRLTEIADAADQSLPGSGR